MKYFIIFSCVRAHGLSLRQLLDALHIQIVIIINSNKRPSLSLISFTACSAKLLSLNCLSLSRRSCALCRSTEGFAFVVSWHRLLGIVCVCECLALGGAPCILQQEQPHQNNKTTFCFRRRLARTTVQHAISLEIILDRWYRRERFVSVFLSSFFLFAHF